MTITASEAAELSSIAYNNVGTGIPTGWDATIWKEVQIPGPDQDTIYTGGYYGRIFVKLNAAGDEIVDVVIAHRGTDNVNDWVTNNLPLAAGYQAPQITNANDFTAAAKIAVAAYETDNFLNPINIDSATTHTGHSLGGYLAIHAANDQGTGIDAITFDNPKTGITIADNTANVTTYLNAPNIVNTAGDGEHLGTVYELDRNISTGVDHEASFTNMLKGVFFGALQIPAGLTSTALSLIGQNEAPSVFALGQTLTEHDMNNIITRLGTANTSITNVPALENYLVGDFAATGVLGGAAKEVWDSTLHTISDVTETSYGNNILSIINAPGFDEDAPIEGIVTGGTGNDTVGVLEPADMIFTDAGDDVIHLGDGNHIIDGGTGNDTIAYTGSSAGVDVDLGAGNTYVGPVVGSPKDTFSNIENAIGSDHADEIVGDAAANEITGGEGNDQLDGGAGADTYIVGEDWDVIDDDTGTLEIGGTTFSGYGTWDAANHRWDLGGYYINLAGTALIAEDSTDPNNGFVLDDWVDGDYGITLDAAGFGDMDGKWQYTELFGFPDVIYGMGISVDEYHVTRTDTLDSRLTYSGPLPDDNGIHVDLKGHFTRIISTGELVTLHYGYNEIEATEGNDIIRGNDVSEFNYYDPDYPEEEAVNLFYGLGGDDILDGRGAMDGLFGGDGNDILIGGTGNDGLNGGAGNDIFVMTQEATALDGIGDFTSGEDLIDLSGDDFADVWGLHNITLVDDIYGNTEINFASGYQVILNGVSAASLSASDFIFRPPVVAYGTVNDDYLEGFGGYDTFYSSAGWDVIDGGDGIDTVFYDGDTAGAKFNIRNDADYGSGFTGDVLQLGSYTVDQLANIETASGTDFDDTFIIEEVKDGMVLDGLSGVDRMQIGAADMIVNMFTQTITQGVNVMSWMNIETITAFDAGVMGIGGTGRLILGTRDDDSTLTNTLGNDEIHGFSGEDVIDGGDGNDLIYGGDNNDILYGNLGKDELHGDAGNDELHGDDGHDTLYGGDDEDILNGGLGNDTLYGDTGDDTLNGNEEDDTLYGGLGTDALYGDDGADDLFGGDGVDTLHGGAGDDELFGDDGDDVLHGELGDDSLDGGLGNDTLHGGDGDDKLGGSNGDDVLYGEAGEDQLYGELGDDTIYGGDGDDLIRGHDGNDELHGGEGNDELHGMSDDDVIYGNENDDIIDGGKGNDTIYGGDDDDMIFGGLDDDTLHGDAGDDIIGGGDGVDELHGGQGTDILYGGTGNDTLHGGADDDSLVGEAGDDTLRGDQGNDELHGQAGDDVLVGGADADTLYGGAGADVFTFEALSDSYHWTQDNIKDFDQGTDLIDVSALGFTNIAAGLGTGTTLGFIHNAGDTLVVHAPSDFSIRIDGMFGLSDVDFIY